VIALSANCLCISPYSPVLRYQQHFPSFIQPAITKGRVRLGMVLRRECNAASLSHLLCLTLPVPRNAYDGKPLFDLYVPMLFSFSLFFFSSRQLRLLPLWRRSSATSPYKLREAMDNVVLRDTHKHTYTTHENPCNPDTSLFSLSRCRHARVHRQYLQSHLTTHRGCGAAHQERSAAPVPPARTYAAAR
jgi:hypothetical protein